ncbi:unnamed protein product [Ilex paraguariensis]|uniref:Serine carboxypeptidase-like 18 n=1 Tax=Ilex paraguariensis TaxID=185542 RepID=A0ABC8RN45_9AQUA
MAPELPPLTTTNHQQAREVFMVMLRSFSINGLLPVLVRVILLLLLFKFNITVSSQSIIKTLPGFSGDLPVKMETGYVGVGERDDVQLFYYFIESERNPKDDPLMLWLAGGPGCSALRAFFYEIGPFSFNYSNSIGDKPQLEQNPYSWTKVANIIFIDQPVGTGFSYANTPEAYISSDTISATQAYDFLRKWLVDHSKFLTNPLYISGISYVGMVVPIIVQEIYNGNEAGNEPQLNIKGYILSNPLTDKNGDVNSRVEYAHRVALLSDELYESTKANCQGKYIDVDPKNLLCLRDLQEVDKSYIYNYATNWATSRAVQEALHVREGIKTEWVQCNNSIEYSFGKTSTVAYTFNVPSTVGYHRNLTSKNCRALIMR